MFIVSSHELILFLLFIISFSYDFSCHVVRISVSVYSTLHTINLLLFLLCFRVCNFLKKHLNEGKSKKKTVVFYTYNDFTYCFANEQKFGASDTHCTSSKKKTDSKNCMWFPNNFIRALLCFQKQKRSRCDICVWAETACTVTGGQRRSHVTVVYVHNSSDFSSFSDLNFKISLTHSNNKQQPKKKITFRTYAAFRYAGGAVLQKMEEWINSS